MYGLFMNAQPLILYLVSCTNITTNWVQQPQKILPFGNITSFENEIVSILNVNIGECIYSMSGQEEVIFGWNIQPDFRHEHYHISNGILHNGCVIYTPESIQYKVTQN